MNSLVVLAVCLILSYACAEDAPAPPPPAAPKGHGEDPGVFRPPGFPYVAPYLPYGYGYSYYPYVYSYPGYYPYHQVLPYHPSPLIGGPHAMTFRGKFTGTCSDNQDGLYYVDERSFAFCSGQTKTIQPCAEGTANPAFADFQNGKYHYFYDFCSVHLQAAENSLTVIFAVEQPWPVCMLTGSTYYDVITAGGFIPVPNTFLF